MRRILCLVFIGVVAVCQPAIAQTAGSWIEKGTSLERQGVYAEAVKAYTKAIQDNPGSAEAYLKRGVALFSVKKTNAAEALADLTEAIRLAPEHAEAYYRRGLVNYYVLNNEQGRKDMETACALGHADACQWLEKREGSGADTSDDRVLQTTPVVHFDHDRSDIKSSYRTLLDAVGMAMIGEPDTSIVLSGHADSTGTDEYNQALSLRRATAVKGYLVKNLRVPAQRITVRGYGAGMPVASNSTEEGRAANRRVEIAGVTTASDISERSSQSR